MTDISFCITTSGTNDQGVQEVIDSIVALKIPTYEIIIVGGATTTIELNNHIKHVPFDENAKAHITIYGHPGRWTTRKKNLGVENSQYEVCVIMHDYIKFYPNWYAEFEKYGTHWDVCVHQCLNYIGARSDGWRVHFFPGLPFACMVPYDVHELVPFMAIQGNYAVVKREHFLKYPFDENRLWGQEEEMEWSRRLVPNSYVRCNPNCIVQYTRPREWDQRHATDDVAQMNAHMNVFDALRAYRISNIRLNGE